MNVLKFVTGHRGIKNTVRRTGQIFNRFGHSPGRMGARFERFMDLLDEFDIRPTFPITALPLSRNARFAHRLVDRGAELAVHAWSHIDLTTLDYQGQKEHMGQAIQLFRDSGVPFTGFRAPYLHWNDDTMRVVEDYQFRYSSNQTIWWDVIDSNGLEPEQQEGIQRGMAFYKPVRADAMRSVPFRRRGFVEIPVSLPDDEIPLDRMYIHDVDFLERMWCAILEQSHERGELFTLQLHPERIDFFTPALRTMLAGARAKNVWVATLDEIAQWWTDKSGNHISFAREDDGHRADVKACAGTTLYVRENAVTRSQGAGAVFVRGPERPCVGVLPGSERTAVQALEDLGYVVEAGERAEDYAIHLGALADAGYRTIRDALARIDACRGPLLHFGTWPHGHPSALAVTGDIDALTIWDFMHRFRGA